MIIVFFCCYTTDGEQVTREEMPAVPRVGDTVHLSPTGDPDDSRAWQVFHVSWVTTDDGLGSIWHAEVALRRALNLVGKQVAMATRIRPDAPAYVTVVTTEQLAEMVKSDTEPTRGLDNILKRWRDRLAH